ncbi:PREDICTED: ATP synthase F(0) complex subunit C1, mitochondrial [Corvus brachyrhynchos]|uniref:ATP synthase F(0) complex subunit C1, mitochondrial n=1 Tax=Corvus brachyrhynchos TaxID=85066 RepID=UPI00081679CE|nr:PREDICTED: ATP synthase F(0) complex subunit C1, mitochondrial [Corvus brachyrhynchos]
MQAPVALLGSPVLFRCCSRALARPVSVSVFGRPEPQTAQVSLGSGIPPVFSVPQDTDVCSQSLPCAPSPRNPAWFGASPALIPCVLCFSGFRNPSLKQQLFSYAILGFALSEAMGLFCLMVAFLILFAMCGLPDPPAAPSGRPPAQPSSLTIKQRVSLKKSQLWGFFFCLSFSPSWVLGMGTPWVLPDPNAGIKTGIKPGINPFPVSPAP